MSKWNKVSPRRKEQVFAFNRLRAADSEAARDMRTMAATLGSLPKGQLKKLLTDELITLLGKYGVEV